MEKVVATNRRARHEYEITDVFEAGLVLRGSEVKSLRAGNANISEAYAVIRDGEAWLVGAHIAPYDYARDGGHEPTRSRKLLLHRRQIDRLAGTIAEKRMALIPLRLYFKDGRAKIELGLGKGRRAYDKRQAIRRREEQRDMERALRYRT